MDKEQVFKTFDQFCKEQDATQEERYQLAEYLAHRRYQRTMLACIPHLKILRQGPAIVYRKRPRKK